MSVNTNITFTSSENEVISIIKQVIEKYTPTTKAYLVGGFVRDKLLGIPSNDIDVMLSNVSGEDFAKMVTKHLNFKDAHVIQSNPEKSKFITTAKAYIPLSNGQTQEVDFAQARSEVYNENSRIPNLKPATPQDDAMRRDLTINAIFYDISNGKVVDFTGKGIQDLITMTIRTPEDPMKTFSEDPLRLLRVIRFSAKYDGKIDPETYKAMTNPELRTVLKQKVSKERLGAEIVKMLKNPNAQQAIELLKNTGIFEDIVSEAVKGTPYEGRLAQLDTPQNNEHHKLTIWGHTLESVKNVLDTYKDADPEKRVVMALAALMHDLGKLDKSIWGESKSHPGSTSYHGHEDESSKISELILKFLKIEPYIQQVSGLSKQHMRPHQLVEDSGASALRRFVRKMGELSLDWLDVFNLALADANAKDVIKDPSISPKYQELEGKLQQAMSSLKPLKEKSGIQPVLNGNEAMQILGIKPGPWMSEITEFVKELRDDNPDISKEEAAQKLKDRFPSPAKTPTKTANSGEKKAQSNCPMHLFNSKINNIKTTLSCEKYYETVTILKSLKDEYGNDENVTRLIANVMFIILTKDQTLRDNDLLDFLFKKAEDNFFDHDLCAYVLGMLIMLKTPTEDKVIKQVGNRVLKMNKELLTKILNSLPKNIENPKIKEELLGKALKNRE